MLWYALRRLVLAVPLLIGITCISFAVIHLAPGEPVDLQAGNMGVKSSAQARALLREMYGLDQPIAVQYWNWVGRLARLDFGRSFAPDGRPVLQKIGERLPVTLMLNIAELLIIVALAVPIGMASATRCPRCPPGSTASSRVRRVSGGTSPTGSCPSSCNGIRPTEPQTLLT